MSQPAPTLAINYVDVPNQLGRKGRMSMTCARQQRCYLELVKYIRVNGKSPPMDELAYRMGVPNDNRSVASQAVAVLEDLGWITVRRHPVTNYAMSGGIELLEPVLAGLTPITRGGAAE